MESPRLSRIMFCMTDPEQLIEELADAAERVGFMVRRVPISRGRTNSPDSTGNRPAAGGGLVRLKGTWTLFIDTEADPQDQLPRLIESLRDRSEFDNIYISPSLRDMLDSLH